MIEGVFLYYPETPHIEQTVAALNQLQLLYIKIVPATPETVSNLVPYALERDCNSWLILFNPGCEQDLLILPFDLDENGYGSFLNKLNNIDELLQEHHDDRRHPFAYLRPYVYANLSRFEQLWIDVSAW